ncbi:penicillin-binding transpeptidase domain-containing protein [Streptomyces flavalbus]|uniref:Penicillin-binding transpeptidase domain-containing protein n=1 Tax=Streptomyces flavalbus TaxID=2665155 RepID=A0ABW2WIH7_9ACTN
MNGKTRLVVAGTTVALLAAGGYAVVDAAGFLRETGPLTADEISSASRGFLDAWAEGDVAAAAGLTDDAGAASDALTLFRRELGPRLTVRPAPTTSATVPFDVTVRLDGEGAGSVWTYGSALTVVRDPESDGEARVAWSPKVVHPRLANGDRLELARADGMSVRVTDRDGRRLTAEEFPSLASVIPELGERYGEKLGGRPGTEVRVTRRDGRPGPSLHEVSAGTPATLRTTLSARVQRAAERAVADHPRSSAVAVAPSSGEILAVANNREDGFNAAFLGQRAPGSTLKVITSAALLEEGVVSPFRRAECPKYAEYGGATFHNLDGFEIPGGTFSDAFARSCNTTFVKAADDIGSDTVAREAREVFGLGLEWHSGLATFDGSVPEAKGAEKAAGMIGQGRVQVNALNMASVAATVVAGRFRQPVLVAPELAGQPVAEAPRSLPRGVAGQLRDLMRRTATEGTAARALAGLPGDVGAKTGSAEVGGAAVSDSWFTGFRDDVAAAAVVEEGGHGGDAAGPVVREILAAGDAP